MLEPPPFPPQPKPPPPPPIAGMPSPKRWDLAGRFHARHGIRAPGPVLALAFYLLALTMMQDRISTQLIIGNNPFRIESWAQYWIVSTIGAVIPAFIIYLVGGWWYRQRIVFSGAKDADWGWARRIYVFSFMINCVPVLITTIIETMIYTDPIECANDDGHWAYFLLVPFPFLAIFASWRGVLNVFPVGYRRAMIWMLILPIIVTLIRFGFMLIPMLFLFNPPPDTDITREFRSRGVEFSYPSNWEVEQGAGDYYVSLLSPQGASLTIQLYAPIQAPEDQLAAAIAGYGETTSHNERAPLYRGLESNRRTVVALNGSDEYVASVDVIALGLWTADVHMTAWHDHWKTVTPGFELVERTLVISPPDEWAPDVTAPSRYDSRIFSFSHPRSWTVEPGTTDVLVEINTPQGAWMTLLLYPPTGTPREELEEAISDYADATPHDIREPFYTVGSTLRRAVNVPDEDRSYAARVDVLTLGEWNVDIHATAWPEDWALVRPGFELIERTLSITTPEQIAPDTANPIEHEGERASFFHPGDWEVTDSGDRIEVMMFHDAWASVVLYDFETSIEEEFDATRSYLADRGEVHDTDARFDTWGPFTGEGRTYRVVSARTEYTVRVFIAEAESGRLIEIEEAAAAGADGLVEPGLAMIRNSFAYTPLAPNTSNR